MWCMPGKIKKSCGYNRPTLGLTHNSHTFLQSITVIHGNWQFTITNRFIGYISFFYFIYISKFPKFFTVSLRSVRTQVITVTRRQISIFFYTLGILRGVVLGPVGGKVFTMATLSVNPMRIHYLRSNNDQIRVCMGFQHPLMG